jgi:1-acyl-sn-glycerol-3-phosphate acyltransferase
VLQGALIPGIGSFPARASRDVIKFIAQQARKNEPLVVFPEGTVYCDGTTHPFKTGAARIALSLNEMGVPVPIVPVAIRYDKNDKGKVQVSVGQPVLVHDYVEHFRAEPALASKSLTSSLHREVCHLRMELGDTADQETLFIGSSARSWAPLLCSLPTADV